MITALITAGGSGRRFGSKIEKQYLRILGKPLVYFSLKTFQECRFVDAVALVVSAGNIDYCRENVVKKYGLDKVKIICAGGSRRQDSIRSGLEKIKELLESGEEGNGEKPGNEITQGQKRKEVGEDALIIIHDAARPLIGEDVVIASIEAARRFGAAVAGHPLRDTIKMIEQNDGEVKKVKDTPERRRFWAVQTPQAFRFNLIYKAHRAASEAGYYGTDDASLVERAGETVVLFRGPADNIKVTFKEDLDLVKVLLEKRQHYDSGGSGF